MFESVTGRNSFVGRKFWLGDSEGNPTHWGGGPRQVEVLEELTLATGKPCWRVRIQPKIPALHGMGPLSEAVLSTRYTTDQLADVVEAAVPVRLSRVIREPVDGTFSDGDLTIDYYGDLAPTDDQLPEEFDIGAFWERIFQRIRRYVERHGHSRMPSDYHDEDGLLGVIVENIRYRNAGSSGISEGPFPGVDYEADLNALEGWSWNIADSREGHP